jgi:hypothetical protein
MSHRVRSPKYLKGHWSLKDNALDLSGYGNNGTWTGTEAYADGPFGRAVGEFPGGGGGYIDCGANVKNGITTTSTLSVTCWADIADIAAGGLNDGLFAFNETFAVQPEYGLSVQTNNFFGILDQAATGPIAYTVNKPIHLAMTYQGTTFQLFIDGVLESAQSITKTIDLSSTRFYIGTFNQASLSFDGGLWDVRLYNIVLTNVEIIEVMNMDRR